LAAKMQNEECKMLKLLRAAQLFIVAAWKKSHAKYGIKNDPPNGKNCDREAASQHYRCIVQMRSHFVNFSDLAKGPKESQESQLLWVLVPA